ncbi:MAG: hypothetical protein DMG72_16660 [Acidobacteria bacterium]|nr:MAG: hypothetical protein DMG72_16660 [Acidobacteriota bacterium]
MLSATILSPISRSVHPFWSDETAQDIAEYAVILAVILVLVVGTVRLIGSNSNTRFFSCSKFDTVGERQVINIRSDRGESGVSP